MPKPLPRSRKSLPKASDAKKESGAYDDATCQASHLTGQGQQLHADAQGLFKQILEGRGLWMKWDTLDTNNNGFT